MRYQFAMGLGIFNEFEILSGGGGYGRKRKSDQNSEEEKDTEKMKIFYEKGSVFAYRMNQESV